MKILVLIGFYLPGFKAGGQIRSLSNMVDRLGSEHQFYVVTRDRDLGDREPYPEVKAGLWQHVRQAQVMYLAPGPSTAKVLSKIVQDVGPDMLYLNSPFDVRFGLLPLLLARIGVLPKIPTVISAHGIFAPNAMALKRWKKQIFLVLERVAGLMRGAEWHATCFEEEQDIERVLGEKVPITTAANLCGAVDESLISRDSKQPGKLRLVFLGRIARIKNLDGAIKIVRGLNAPVTLDIYGPIEDPTYWHECQMLLSNMLHGVEITYRGMLAPSAVHSTLTQYDAFLLPTKNENYGHAIVEAFSAGCPVVISDRTPWRNLAELGAGWDLPLEDHGEYRRALMRLVEMGEAPHAELRNNVRRYWRTIANNQHEVETYRQLFEKAAGRFPSKPGRRAA